MKSTELQDLLELWFSPRVEKLWFNSTSEFDLELKNKYEKLYEDACSNNFQDYLYDVNNSLALIILFDQIPLNIYRNQAKSFMTEAKAREISRFVMDKKWDNELKQMQKTFLYLPFMHSENLQDQDMSVSLFEKAGMNENLRYARHHRDIIVRFGRFPHRNAILQRQSTQQELDYLASKEAFKG